MSISETLKRIYKGESREEIVEAVELVHQDSGLVYRFVKFPEDIYLTNEDGSSYLYKSTGFVIKLPKAEEKSAMDFSISFGLISYDYIKEIEDIVENYNSRIEVIYRIYTANNFNTPQTQVPYRFFVNNIDIQQKTITLSGLMLESLNDTIPNKRYTKDIFHGLKYLK